LPRETNDHGENLLIYVNEISDKMRGKAKDKLRQHERINFTSYNALSFSQNATTLRERFRTVLCSQTFHLMPDEDRFKIARSIYYSLCPGGIAIIIEEDPFRISPSPPIEPVALFIRSIACPIKNRGDLIGIIKGIGFKKLESRAIWPIDDKHVMRLHVFQRPENAGN
jgi:hypothetical protein